jgi:hypothetical protein
VGFSPVIHDQALWDYATHSSTTNPCPHLICHDQEPSNAGEVLLFEDAAQDRGNRRDAGMRRTHQEDARV